MYESPLAGRYSSVEMQNLFSKESKYVLWRKLWLSLAKAQKANGLPITDEQIDDLETHLETIDFSAVKRYEETFQHEVMAHIHAYGDDAPTAKKIIHLGATSSFVMDNGDLIQMKTGLEMLVPKVRKHLDLMGRLAEKYAALPCLGWTHLQPAQPVTVGKRIAVWLQDLVADFQDLSTLKSNFPLLGVRGATGSQASFLQLFNGDESKIEAVEMRVASDFGFSHLFPLATQTYPRKFDTKVLSIFASFAASAHKIGTDLRLLAHLDEMHEGFGENQIGSSAMPHKRNPIYAERLCSLSRYLINLSRNAFDTAGVQWLERSLDDSANRRLTISEAFLCMDAILIIFKRIFSNLVVNEAAIRANLERHLPTLSMESLLMIAVKKGADRQKAHEIMRLIAQTGPKDPLKEVCAALSIDFSQAEIDQILNAENLTGRCKNQVENFLALQRPIWTEK